MRHIEKLKKIISACGKECSKNTNGEALNELLNMAENGEIGGESLIEKLVLNGAKDFVIGSHSNPNGSSIGTYIIRMDNTKDYSISIRDVGAQRVYPIFYSKDFNEDIILEYEEGAEFYFNNGESLNLYKRPFGIRIMNEEGVFVDPTQQITTS